MADPFKTLGLKPGLVYDREQLNQAFRESGKSSHPDAGGSEEAFAQLQSSLQILQSPARRLKAWLELNGVEVEARGSISNPLMDEFGRVGEVTQRIEAVLRKREAAQSALARAMLEGETQLCREQLEVAMARLEALIEEIYSGFARLESGEVALSSGVQWHRDLTFLEKWQAGLRSLFSKLL